MQSIQQLIEVMQALRDPDSGCPWDLQQNFQSLIPYTIEETYEVADAIERNDMDDIKSELGDLLFQIIFYSQLADEQKLFSFNDVAKTITSKLIRRHPHVFANEHVSDAAEQTQQWEKIKQQERAEKLEKNSQNPQDSSILDEVSRTLPSLMRAEKMQKRAAREGFDWPNFKGAVEKIYEELDEVQQELNAKNIEQEKLEDEMGDLFFSCINLSRHAGLDAERCVRKANLKFERRFRQLEKQASMNNQKIKNMTLQQLDGLWKEVKERE